MQQVSAYVLVGLEERLREAHDVSTSDSAILHDVFQLGWVGPDVEVAQLDVGVAGGCHDVWCGWKGKALASQPFHFCNNCLPGLDAGWIEVLDEQPCERLDSTEGDISLTGVQGPTFHVKDDIVQSESLHFVDGTRPGQQQGKLAPAHLHGLVSSDVEDGLVAADGNSPGVILCVVALGNGTVSNPGVIKVDQDDADVVGSRPCYYGFYCASGAVDQTVADVHVDGQHDFGADCNAQLFYQASGVGLVLGHGHVQLLSALVFGAVDCTDHSLLSWRCHLIELQHVLFVHVFVVVVHVQGVARVVGIVVCDGSRLQHLYVLCGGCGLAHTAEQFCKLLVALLSHDLVQLHHGELVLPQGAGAVQPSVRVADFAKDVPLAHRLQLKQVADGKNTDVAKHTGRVCTLELLQTLVSAATCRIPPLKLRR